MRLASLARVWDGCVRAARCTFLLYTVAEHGLRNIFLICISLVSPLSLGNHLEISLKSELKSSDFEISYAFSARVGPLGCISTRGGRGKHTLINILAFSRHNL